MKTIIKVQCIKKRFSIKIHIQDMSVGKDIQQCILKCLVVKSNNVLKQRHTEKNKTVSLRNCLVGNDNA